MEVLRSHWKSEIVFLMKLFTFTIWSQTSWNKTPRGDAGAVLCSLQSWPGRWHFAQRWSSADWDRQTLQLIWVGDVTCDQCTAYLFVIWFVWWGIFLRHPLLVRHAVHSAPSSYILAMLTPMYFACHIIWAGPCGYHPFPISVVGVSQRVPPAQYLNGAAHKGPLHTYEWKGADLRPLTNLLEVSAQKHVPSFLSIFNFVISICTRGETKMPWCICSPPPYPLPATPSDFLWPT